MVSLDGLLADKIAIVTGASSGIGAVAARVFAKAGATVVLAARDTQAMTAVAQEIADDSGRAHEIIPGCGRAHVVTTDVSDAGSVERLAAETVHRFGRLDVAFDDAGQGHLPAPVGDLARDDFDRCMRVNLGGVFLAKRIGNRGLSATASPRRLRGGGRSASRTPRA